MPERDHSAGWSYPEAPGGPGGGRGGFVVEPGAVSPFDFCFRFYSSSRFSVPAFFVESCLVAVSADDANVFFYVLSA